MIYPAQRVAERREIRAKIFPAMRVQKPGRE